MPGAAAVTSELEGRQHRLDDVLSNLEACLAGGACASARRQLASFHAELNRYIWREEQHLFPLYERSAGSTIATVRLRREHRRIGRLLRALDGHLAADDLASSLGALAALRSVLVLHFTKEEWVIYPMTAGA